MATSQRPQHGLGLVDLLTGLAILATAMAILTPIVTKSLHRIKLAESTLVMQGVLGEMPIPETPVGSRSLGGPGRFTLQWSSGSLPIHTLGNPPVQCRLVNLRLQSDEFIVERTIPWIIGR
jgi:hypothetical protein